MSEALPIIGAAVGFVVTGGSIAGAQAGFALGSLAGGLLFPPKGQNGPQLQDRQVQASTYGLPIPRIYGTTRLAGNVIWSTELLETAVEQGGKGGPPESTVYTYRASFAVSVCSGPIIEFRRIWADGKLIYNSESNPKEDFAAASLVLYFGTEDQLPDPTIQAYKGSTPAYRGQAYAVFTDLQLEKFGNRLPSLSFEVVQTASPASLLVVARDGVTQFDATTGAEISVSNATDGSEPQYTVTFAAGFHWYGDTLGQVQVFNASSNTFSAPIDIAPGDFPQLLCSASDLNGSHVYFGDTASVDARIWKIDTDSRTVVATLTLTGYRTARDMAISADGTLLFVTVETTSGSGGVARIQVSDMSLLGVTATAVGGEGAPRVIVDGDFVLTTAGVKVFELNADASVINGFFTPDAFFATSSLRVVAGELWVGLFAQRLLRFSVAGTTGPRTYTLLNTYILGLGIRPDQLYLGDDGITLYSTRIVTGPLPVASFDTVTGAPKVGFTNPSIGSLPSRVIEGVAGGPGRVLLSDIVTAESALVGLSASDIDVSDLTTTEVRGFTIASAGPVRSGLEQLMMAFGFDAVESGGKVKFVLQGADPVIEVDVLDLAAHEPGNDVPTPLPLTRVEEIELPQRVTIRAPDPAADYQVGAQSDQRLTGRAMSQLVTDLPVVLSASEQKQIAIKALYSAWVARTRTSFVTTFKHADLEPTDVIVVDGNVLKITKRTENGGLISFEASFESGAVFTQSALGADADIPPQIITVRAETGLEFLDLPALRDEDDDAGFYLAASGLTDDEWRGSLLYKSTEGGGAYTEFLAITARSTIGVTDDALGDWTFGNVFDEINSVTVTVRSGTLSSVTYLEVLNGANGAVVGDEVLQFRVATLNMDGSYTLTGLLRGRFATPTTDHVAGERFVFLDPAVLRRAPPMLSEVGQERFYKAVTFGTSLAAADELTFTNTAQSLEPLAPTALGGGRAADGAILGQFIRRTRIGGAWLDNTDVPLSEATESYSIDVFTDGTYTTVERTIATTVQSFAYSAAEQVADFGSTQALIYVDVYQISASVGRGTALRGTI